MLKPNLGILLAIHGDLGAAIEAFQAALKLNPKRKPLAPISSRPRHWPTSVRQYRCASFLPALPSSPTGGTLAPTSRPQFGATHAAVGHDTFPTNNFMILIEAAAKVLYKRCLQRKIHQVAVQVNTLAWG